VSSVRLRNLAGDVGVFALGFDDGDRRQAGEQHVIGGFLAERRPFGDGLVFALFRACTAGVGELLSIGLPAGLDQLLVDQDAGEFFAEHQLFAGIPGALADLLRRFLAGVDLPLQGLQALLEFQPDAIEHGALFFRQALVGARFGIHLPGEDGVLFFFTGDQRGDLLVVFERGGFVAQLGAQLGDFALQQTQGLTGVAGRNERAGLKPAPALPNDW
jgi:hypothetical protein